MQNTSSKEIIYQVYPKSFQDTNDDGIGDIQGVINRLDYIQELGVTTIWLNPIFKSPHVDNGYDVSDYYDVDSQYGTMKEVEKLIEEAHKRDLKVLFDLVLNHTSSSHKWFIEALKGPENPYRAYYIWQKTTENNTLPNNWKSFFGGSVWERDSISGEYYFHLFHKDMPDLNWENKKVRNEMIDIAKFWLNKGVDGFRLDAFIHLDKAEGLPDAKYAEPGQLIGAEEFFANLPRVAEYVKEFSAALRKEYPDVYLLGEASSADPEKAVKYTFPKGQACDSIVSFKYFPMDLNQKDQRLPLEIQEGKLDIQQFKQVMDEWQRKVGKVSEMTLYLNNHDMQRAVSRFGSPMKFRNESAKTLATMMYLQKGIPVILNGEEIGMKNLELKKRENTRINDIDTLYTELLKKGISEDEVKLFLGAISINSSRGAMQWTDDTYAGFSDVEPWSGANQEKIYNVSAQAGNPDSILAYYKKLIQLKKTELFTSGSYELFITASPIMAYQRQYNGEKAVIIANLSEQMQRSPFDKKGLIDAEVLLQTGQFKLSEDSIELSPFASIVLKQSRKGDLL